MGEEEVVENWADAKVEVAETVTVTLVEEEN